MPAMMPFERRIFSTVLRARIYKSKKSELVAIYGRRRVGKSYLVSECFGKKILFKAVGTYMKDGDKDYETVNIIEKLL